MAAPPRAPESRFESLVLDFLSYLELERGLSRNTLDAYRTDLLQYGEYLAAPRPRRARRRARRRRRVPRRAGDGRGAARLLAGDAPPQGRLPALLLQAPAPRRADRRRPDRGAERAAAARSCRRSSTTPRCRSCWRPRRGDRADGPARPGAARGDVRVRPARLGDDRAGGRPTSTCDEGFLRARGKGCKERLVPLGRQAIAAISRLPAQRPPAAGRRPPRGEAVRQLPRRAADPPGPLQDRPAPRARRPASTAR